MGSSPWGVAVDAANNQVFVTNYNSNNVSVIDASSYAKVTTLTVGTSPEGVAVDAANNQVFVANRISDRRFLIRQSNNHSCGHKTCRCGD
ncbi:YncE family protein [Bacillus cereus]|uniref:YncE family protein n=1 Tax=Bacillus cereus TaxID=1396 RepID=UPI0034DE7F33